MTMEFDSLGNTLFLARLTFKVKTVILSPSLHRQVKFHLKSGYYRENQPLKLYHQNILQFTDQGSSSVGLTFGRQ